MNSDIRTMNIEDQRDLMDHQADDMTKTMKPTPINELHTGHIYVCKKSNKEQGILKGSYYVYDSGQLKRFTSRNVTIHMNGDELLSCDRWFEIAATCPFCGCQTCDPFGGQTVIHDGLECAAEWDARVKKYER